MGQSSQQTIIAQGVKVEGDFTSQGAVIIEGEVTGSVQTSENLQVGETAKIHADVTAAAAVVAGEIRGNIIIEGRLDLLETSRVSGDVHAQVLSVAAGAKVNGKVSMDGEKEGGKRKSKKEEEIVEEEVKG
ncbi:MAG: polymer-forming cytoskeletal protein [Candidatus Uhrbacteria bacterium]|nr:polymer-forming cytoskeletal protein [Patescibacteria group bacterium]MBU1907257.1 polymer-forming cytoskeletal protein [Patescibacteria group bacterium]